MAGVFFRGPFCCNFVGVHWFDVLFFEVIKLSDIKFLFCFFLVEGIVEYFGDFPDFII